MKHIGYRVRFTIGLEFGREGCALAHVDQAIKQARHKVALTFGGYTETLHNGGWISPKDALVSERGLTFEVIVPSEKLTEVEPFADYLRRSFDQEAVLVTSSPVEFEFYTGNNPLASGVGNGASYES